MDRAIAPETAWERFERITGEQERRSIVESLRVAHGSTEEFAEMVRRGLATVKAFQEHCEAAWGMPTLTPEDVMKMKTRDAIRWLEGLGYRVSGGPTEVGGGVA